MSRDLIGYLSLLSKYTLPALQNIHLRNNHPVVNVRCRLFVNFEQNSSLKCGIEIKNCVKAWNINSM